MCSGNLDHMPCYESGIEGSVILRQSAPHSRVAAGSASGCSA
jgi:hypothetical protein